MITFQWGKTKVRVPTQECSDTSKQITPLYAEITNMLDGLADEEIDQHLEEHPKIVLLFDVNVAEVIKPYVTHWEEEFDVPDQEAIREFQQAQEALEREMALLQ